MTVSAPAGWRAGQLGDVIELKRGYDLPSRDRRDGPYPIVSSSGPSGTHVEAKVKGPGVVTGRYGTIGQVFFVEGDYWPLNTALYVYDFKGSDPRFVSYFLRSVDFNKYVDKAAVPGVNRNHVHMEEVAFPPLDEQRRIAAVLGALDDKIELNRKMNRTLEELTQALFKSWFIDFDGHDDLVDSEIGPVPRGWKVIPLAQTGRWVSGGTPSKNSDDYWGGNIPWFSAKSLGPLWLSDSDDRVTEAGADAGSRRVPRRSVLFIVRGMSLATEWRIGMTTREATLNQDLKAIVDDGTVLPELILLWLLVNRDMIRAQADEAGHGTKRLPTDVLYAHAMVMPTRSDQERVAAPLVLLLARIEQNLAETTSLTDLRDTLLPKLISGELRVPEAEELVEATS